ncbi:unnamed protein product [Heligmosomoides polygyrus]|uniref:HTH arsR-type domain-containing protein n=1 Tax=Heligmosomoides polygyrus TaxID=6339 RepID=A0A183GRE2_HELPZ|nr:unnamed protein product [Heligmosomoides polygyrus]
MCTGDLDSHKEKICSRPMHQNVRFSGFVRMRNKIERREERVYLLVGSKVRTESDVDNDRLRQLVESDPRRTTRELAQDVGVHYATIARHLHQLANVHKLAQWVPMTSPNATVSDVLR